MSRAFGRPTITDTEFADLRHDLWAELCTADAALRIIDDEVTISMAAKAVRTGAIARRKALIEAYALVVDLTPEQIEQRLDEVMADARAHADAVRAGTEPPA